MRAVRLHAYANPPRIDDVASAPRPETGQMAIDVAAVGIGAWDAGVTEEKHQALGRVEQLIKDLARVRVTPKKEEER